MAKRYQDGPQKGPSSSVSGRVADAKSKDHMVQVQTHRPIVARDESIKMGKKRGGGRVGDGGSDSHRISLITVVAAVVVVVVVVSVIRDCTMRACQ